MAAPDSEAEATTQSESTATATTMTTIDVRYVGEQPFVYGDQVVKTGDTVALPADEVEAWGANAPEAFQKES